MTTDKTYFVELKPCGIYFFGSERTFNTSEKDKNGNEIMNYFAESNPFPQQTAIFGLLRHVLLVLYNRLNANIDEKNEIIGPNFENENQSEKKGLIQCISPLAIVKSLNGKKEFFIPAPLTKQKNVNLNYEKVKFNSFTRVKVNSSPWINGYSAKTFDNTVQWQSLSGILEENIFYKSTKVGIDKKKKDEAYFRQIFYGLRDNFSFGVWVQFDNRIDEINLIDILMPFGGDQSLFKICFHSDIPNIFIDNQTPSQSIYLISDALVDNDFFENVEFAISEYCDFKFLKTKTKDFYLINNQADKSSKMRLLKRGSVFYSNRIEKLTEHLKSNKKFRDIGYNYFKFI